MTFSLQGIVRKHFDSMPAYQPIFPFEVVSDEIGIPADQIIKLDANENPYGCLPEVFDALARLKTAHIYPDPESRKIRAMLAEHHQIEGDSIVIGAGADELIEIIIRLVIDPHDKLLNCPPTFGMYAFDGQLSQAQIIEVPRRLDFSVDFEAVRTAIVRERPKLIFLSNPNNPDGRLLPQKALEATLDLPILVVVDEAYINFSPEGTSWINRVQDYDNLIVLRTFSKWAGLAGLRIGYGVFPQDFVPIVMKTKQPYNVSVAAEGAACISMQHINQLHANRALILAEKQRLFNKLGEIPWLMPHPSDANFILVSVKDRKASHIKKQLRNQGILVRHFDKPGIRNHIRISVGKPEDTNKLMAALHQME